MGVLDRFLNAMKLNDNDGFDDDDFLDDEMDDFEEEAPKKRFFKKQNEEDDLGDLDMDEKVPSGKEKSKAKSFQKSGSTSSPRPYSTSSAKTYDKKIRCRNGSMCNQTAFYGRHKRDY